MALTVSIDHRTVEGNLRVIYATITFDTSYPTGGEALDPVTDLGVTSLIRMEIAPAAGYVFEYDYTNNKVKVYGQEPTSATTGVIALSEVANATNLSTVSTKIKAYGRY